MPNKSSKEENAVLMLKSRPAHLATPPFPAEKVTMKEFILMTPFHSSFSQNWENKTIPWQSHFKSLGVLHIQHRQSFNTRALHLFACKEFHTLLFTGFNTPGTLSCVKMRVEEGASYSYPNHSPGCIYIDSIDACGDYRYGTTFIQLAIEYSLLCGYEGKVRLTATPDSTLFYLKLGFVPLQDKDYISLMNGNLRETCFWYLPRTSIEIWKEKIAHHKVLPLGAKSILNDLIDTSEVVSFNYQALQWLSTLNKNPAWLALLFLALPLAFFSEWGISSFSGASTVTSTIYRFFNPSDSSIEETSSTSLRL